MTQTIVVTGANRGIGYAVAQALVAGEAAASRRIVLLCRDAAAGERARTSLAQQGHAEVLAVSGALDSRRGIEQAAQALDAACPTLDVLIHNAGSWPQRRVLNEDGLEQAFVVNHLAPFLLNRRLERKLSACRARVVQVSAGLYVKGKPDLQRSPRGDDFSALSTYATTKLYNLALLPLFAERFGPLGVTINALHPGVIRTGLGARDDALGLLLALVKRLWKAPRHAAPPVLRLALDPALADVTGRYYDGTRELPLAAIARDRAQAEALWQQAEQLTGLSTR
jgi:NAD(P)-dependent dehydrogenase (short-subunit alcohol dehydrogenase family)